MDPRWGLIPEETPTGPSASGAFDNSPQFQLRVRRPDAKFVPTGRLNPNSEVKLRCDHSAGFPACGFWRLSSRQFPHGNTGLESPVNPQTGMSALQHFAADLPLATSVLGLKFVVVRSLAGLKSHWFGRPCGTGVVGHPPPAVETAGYCQIVPAGRDTTSR